VLSARLWRHDRPGRCPRLQRWRRVARRAPR
jgi:hypothetical protein